MGKRWQRLLGEVGKFLAVGGAATLVALVLFNLLVHGFTTGDWKPPLNTHPLLGYVIANTVGMLISYRGTRRWAFKDRPPVHADGGRTAYFAINAVTMLIPIACLKISRDVLNLNDPWSDNVSANVVGLGLGMVARFYLFRTYVFKRPVHLGHSPLTSFLEIAQAHIDLAQDEAKLQAREQRPTTPGRHVGDEVPAPANPEVRPQA